ncbi:MAG: transcriptional regulator GcvA [Burkholderiales bacterium]|nr:transcriptional regulator GcvA [Burkholderiales bacterium]
MYKPRELPALDLLKAFEAAARHLSFTRAGAELFLSQSAVSRQIQQLETQLGLPLFIRRTRALLLTEAGQRYYRDVSQALHQLREAGASLSATRGDRVVTVTTAMTFASLWLVPQLADFQRQHPDIAVHVAADNTVLDLERERMDVAIRYSTRQHAGAGAVRLFGERVLPVCSPALVAGKKLRTPADLKNFVLLNFEDPQQLTPWLTWAVWFEVMRTPMPATKSMLRFSHYDMLLRAAINGQGIALGRLPLISAALEDGSLVAPLVDTRYSASTQDRAYWLMATPAARERPEVRTFLQWVKERSAPLGQTRAGAE